MTYQNDGERMWLEQAQAFDFNNQNPTPPNPMGKFFGVCFLLVLIGGGVLVLAESLPRAARQIGVAPELLATGAVIGGVSLLVFVLAMKSRKRRATARELARQPAPPVTKPRKRLNTFKRVALGALTGSILAAVSGAMSNEAWYVWGLIGFSLGYFVDFVLRLAIVVALILGALYLWLQFSADPPSDAPADPDKSNANSAQETGSP